MSLCYTICFCRCRDKVIMLHRNRPPNAGLWNGLGGKIEAGESPLDCIRREVWEEAGIDLGAAARLRFAGIVSWDAGVDRTRPSTGMYAYVADLGDGWPIFTDPAETPDGLLAWQPVAWVCDRANGAVVANLPSVLPALLVDAEPVEQHCQYVAGQLIGIVSRPLSPVVVYQATISVDPGLSHGTRGRHFEGMAQPGRWAGGGAEQPCNP